MFRQNKKKNFFIGFFLAPYFLTLLCLGVLAVASLPVYKNARQRVQADKEIMDLGKEISALETENEDLKKLKIYLESDQFAEKEARLNLGLKKKGEQVAVIEKIETAAGGDGSAGGDQPENKNSNPVKWWNYFFGN
jgi:cell division protein FtsB